MATQHFTAHETLLWSVMHVFETQAVHQYRDWAPELATPAKSEASASIARTCPDPDVVWGSSLAPAIRALLESARDVRGEAGILAGQGLVLERSRIVVYRSLARSAGAGALSLALAAAAASAAGEVADLAARRFAQVVESAARFDTFCAATDDVLHKLDAVGEGVDRELGAPFNLHFAEVIGELVAELVPTCVTLGMERRKVMSHLAGALMGL